MRSRSVTGRVSRVFVIVGSLLIWVVGGRGHAAEQQGPDGMIQKREIEEFLGADDLLDERLVATERRLVAAGERVYPMLADLLSGTNDAVPASRILSVFVESTGDKTIPRKAIIRFIGRMLMNAKMRNTDHEQNLINAAEALGAIGNHQDSAVLYPLLEHPSEFVRLSAVRALAKIGNAGAAERIETVLERRANGLTAREIENDKSFSEAYEAIGRIKYRALLLSKN